MISDGCSGWLQYYCDEDVFEFTFQINRQKMKWQDTREDTANDNAGGGEDLIFKGVFWRGLPEVPNGFLPFCV